MVRDKEFCWNFIHVNRGKMSNSLPSNFYLTTPKFESWGQSGFTGKSYNNLGTPFIFTWRENEGYIQTLIHLCYNKIM